MHTTTPETPVAAPAGAASSRPDAGAAVLWASFFIILGMTISLAGRHSANDAYAGNVSAVGQLTALTSKTASDDETLAILDGREEKIYIYGVTGARSLELLQVEDLKALFNQARGAGGGQRR